MDDGEAEKGERRLVDGGKRLKGVYALEQPVGECRDNVGVAAGADGVDLRRVEPGKLEPSVRGGGEEDAETESGSVGAVIFPVIEWNAQWFHLR
jgi:hypothetical protein